MSDLGWSLGIVVPLSEVTAPANILAAETARNANGILRLTLALVTAFFFASLLGVILTNRRLTRPIADLVQGTAAVADGDLDVYIRVDHPGRIGKAGGVV